LPPCDVHFLDDVDARQYRNIERVRDLRRLLDELVVEIGIPRLDPANADSERTVDWEIEKPLPARLDCFLASSVWRWLRDQSLDVSPERLLDEVFDVLGIGGPNATYTGSGSIRDARARKLIR